MADAGNDEQKFVDQVLQERCNALLMDLEEDCIHSGKSQFNAADRCNKLHFRLGVGSVVASAIAGGTYLADVPQVAAGISFLVALLAGLMTFLKPNDTGASHKKSGDQYLAIKNEARLLRRAGLLVERDPDQLLAKLHELSRRRDALNEVSLQPSNADFKKAKAGIDAGEAKYQTEGE
jgi:hypothetical protein